MPDKRAALPACLLSSTVIPTIPASSTDATVTAASASIHCCGLPMRTQLTVELTPALLREENPGTFELDSAPGPGDRVGQPPRPLHVEIHVVRSPHNQRRSSQRPESRFDRDRVRVVESGKETLKVARPALGSDERPQVDLDAVVDHSLG